MNQKTAAWAILFVIGGLALFARAASRPHGMGQVYVRPVPVNADVPGDLRMRYTTTRPDDPAAIVSWPRTVGIWLAAFFTLAILSFLYRDNVFYKLAEAVFVGVTAAWAMVVGFWEGIVDKLLANLCPLFMDMWALPDLIPGEPWRERSPLEIARLALGIDDGTADGIPKPAAIYLVPLALGLMLLWRLAPRGTWIARWPLAFVVGTFAGLRLITFLEADFVAQIRNTIVPLVAFSAEGRFDFWGSVRNITLVTGVLSCLTYFFFSVEHRGLVGRVSQLGIWFLMVTFGASFAFTVMGRIALLAARVEFLLDDWLWLIDPTGKRPDGW